MNKMTNGDVLVLIENMLSKGLVEEFIDKDGNLRYNAKPLEDVIIRCKECDFLTPDMERSLDHSIKFKHFADVTMYKIEQRDALVKEIFRKNNKELLSRFSLKQIQHERKKELKENWEVINKPIVDHLTKSTQGKES